ncbi:MAG: XrtA system polysaccharide chain length determinant [Pseudomonadota bacterium]
MNPAIDKTLGIARSCWRFRWLALAVAWAVALTGWTLVLLLPSRYDTEARVYVDTSSLLRPLLEGLTVASNTANQVDMVRRAILGRPQLERVIDSTALKGRARNPTSREQLVSHLSQRIRITGDLQSRNFSIMYSDSDPKVSFDVVNTLLGSFLDQSVQANRDDSDSAQQFLVQQLREYEQRLIDSETKLADFKRANIGSMPDDRGGYFERTQAEMTELDRQGAALSVATHRRDELRQRLLGNNRLGESGVPAASSVDGRLAEARARLDEMLLNFTEAHPDVIALKESIAALDTQRTRELDSMRRNVDTLGTTRSDSTSLVTQNLQIALNEVDVEIASIRAQMEDRKKRVAELRGAINVLPQVEAELTRLNRDYGTNRTQYDALLQRLESARLSDQAQRSQAVPFKVISPPVLPLTPASPDRVLLSVAVMFAAVGAGAALAYLLSLTRPVFFNTDDLRESLAGIPVISSIGVVRDHHEISAHRLRVAGFAALSGCLVVALGGVYLAYDRWDIEKVTAGGLWQ